MHNCFAGGAQWGMALSGAMRRTNLQFLQQRALDYLQAVEQYTAAMERAAMERTAEPNAPVCSRDIFHLFHAIGCCKEIIQCPWTSLLYEALDVPPFVQVKAGETFLFSCTLQKHVQWRMRRAHKLYTSCAARTKVKKTLGTIIRY